MNDAFRADARLWGAGPIEACADSAAEFLNRARAWGALAALLPVLRVRAVDNRSGPLVGNGDFRITRGKLL